MALQIPPNCDLTLGITCIDKTVPGHTVWRALVDDRFLNPAGIAHGGYLSAILDSAMSASVVTAMKGRKVAVANTQIKVSFLRAAQLGDELTCTATVLKPGTVITFVTGSIVNQRDEVIAEASSTFFTKERSG